MFRSTNSALRWSFQVNQTDTTKISSINMMCGKRMSSSVNETVSGLSKGEAVCQAVNIINAVRMLPSKYEAACLVVEYGHEYFGDEVDLLADKIIGYHGWEDKRLEGVKTLVRNCFGCKKSSHEMVKDLRCNYNDLNKYRTAVYLYLDKLSGSAYSNIGAVLKLKGIVYG